MQLGTIEGKVNTDSFKFRATEEVGKFDFVSVKSNEKWILAQVDEVTKKSGGETIADANIIGYRDKGMTRAPRQVIEPDSIVYSADQDLISETLGLNDDGLRVGNLETNPDIDIFVNPEDFYKHFAVLAQTGAGKSYLTGVLMEEMLEQDFPILIIDPHGEFSSLGTPNPDNEEEPKGYNVKEYSPNTDINKSALPLEFSSLNFEKKELQTLIPDSLTNSQMGVLYNALKRLRDKDEDYSLIDIEDAVQQEDSTAKWNLLNYLEQLEESGLFSDNPIDTEELVEKGRATIINLKAVEPDTAEMAVYLLAKKLFDLRKKDKVPPFMMVFEEAHNFIPEKGFGQAISNPIMRKIASEGRKFGLGIGVISQRPARIDKNVLSQCNTQFILKVTNPNDLKAISKSFEGITSGVEGMIKSLPPGVCFVLGNQYPVMTDVRQRKSKHGGETQTADTYEEKESIRVFETRKRISEVENMYGEKFDTTYYPLYLVENDEKRVLVDGIENKVKAKRSKPSSEEKDIMHKIRQGVGKSDMVEELGLSIAKLSSKIDNLRDKNLVKDGELEVRESILDLEIKEEDVVKEDLMDYQVDEEKASKRLKKSEISKVYYPYYSSDNVVYDPILEEEIG
ncbi:ATP-binding protein [Candidatus Nanosalina sp. VS9-1]|uniref:ATP-binding protein n=1 Tax=Candidatus Nanosalina sp. VS9-1 TaxID=3388566 RepID=UPI0039E02B0C